MSRIIISDIHGCYKTFMKLFQKLPKGVPVTIAGDMVDRGPDSRKVIEFVMNQGFDVVRGNHEEMMINGIKFGKRENGEEFVKVDYYEDPFLYNGGDKTLLSYIIQTDNYSCHDIPTLKLHIEWLKSLPYHILYDEKDKNENKLLVTHSTAGDVWDEYSPDNPIFQNTVTWDRKSFPSKIDGVFNVYGHTPQEKIPTVRDHFACIDTGVYAKGHEKYGRLSALQWPEMVVYQQEYCE